MGEVNVTVECAPHCVMMGGVRVGDPAVTVGQGGVLIIAETQGGNTCVISTRRFPVLRTIPS